MTIFLADIASYQHGLSLASLRPDCIGVFVKVTEGTGYVDPDYVGWRVNSAGLLFGAYHYDTTEDPAAQAAHIAANIGDKSIPLMFDVEKGSGDVAQTLAVAKFAKSLGLNPRLAYLPMWYWEQIGRPDLSGFAKAGLGLIASSYPTSRDGSPAHLYPGDNAAGWGSYGGATPVLYQFTDAADEGGQKIDMNAYRGTLTQLQALLGLNPGTDSSAPPFPGVPLVLRTPYMTGSEVRTWQERMKQRGWSIAVDGSYGPQSQAVCKAFQADSTAHGWPLAQDGIVGPKTWAAAWLRPVSP